MEGFLQTEPSSIQDGMSRLSFGTHMLTGVSGRLGSAVLRAIIAHELIPLHNVMISTSSDSSDPKWESLKAQGVTVRHSHYDDVPGMTEAFRGVKKLLLISSPLVELDMPDKEYGEGRDRQHFNVLLACRAAGVRHIYYTSLGLKSVAPFGPMAAAMRAHDRTEHTLRLLTDIAYTIIREAPYAESWPLYLGFYNGHSERRRELMIAGDGPVSWTSIEDLGLGTAIILADAGSAWTGVTVTLSSQLGVTLEKVAEIVTRIRRVNTRVSVVPEETYIKHYATESGVGEDVARWWVSTYAALVRGEGWHPEAPKLRELLDSVGCEPKNIDTVVEEMLQPYENAN